MDVLPPLGAHDKQKLVKHTLPSASLDVSDALAVGAAVTAAAALSTLLCLGLLFFTVFKPRQAETLTSVRIKEGCFAIIYLVNYTATRSGIIHAPGIGQNSSYNHQRPILSYLIVGWIAFLSTVISLILVSIAAKKTLKYGPDGTGPLEPPPLPDSDAEEIADTLLLDHGGRALFYNEAGTGRQRIPLFGWNELLQGRAALTRGGGVVALRRRIGALPPLPDRFVSLLLPLVLALPDNKDLFLPPDQHGLTKKAKGPYWFPFPEPDGLHIVRLAEDLSHSWSDEAEDRIRERVERASGGRPVTHEEEARLRLQAEKEEEELDISPFFFPLPDEKGVTVDSNRIVAASTPSPTYAVASTSSRTRLDSTSSPTTTLATYPLQTGARSVKVAMSDLRRYLATYDLLHLNRILVTFTSQAYEFLKDMHDHFQKELGHAVVFHGEEGAEEDFTELSDLLPYANHGAKMPGADGRMGTVDVVPVRNYEGIQRVRWEDGFAGPFGFPVGHPPPRPPRPPPPPPAAPAPTRASSS
ncbi:hypothetical protein JCM10296v2_001916 [Rhodotorula toruloides]